MPGRRMDTRVIKEVLRLKSLDLSIREISRSVNGSVGGVHKLIRKAEEAGLKWPLPKDTDDEKLEGLLYPEPVEVRGGKVVPEWSFIHRELKRRGVTRQLLWEEYAARHPDGHYRYSRFCELYDVWRGDNAKPSMRQLHKAGEKCFVDYAGQTVAITDPQTGKQSKAHIFVGVLGASNYTFAEAASSQSLENWLGSHTRMVEFFCGVPSLIVPDNLKSGVAKACYYDPAVNPAYGQWANHYGAVIMPARPRKPKDKAKVEVGVQIVERWILARLRDMELFSVGELNKYIGELLVKLNDSSFQKLPGSRRSEFERVDKPVLRPLPPHSYRHKEIKRARVNIDYHTEYRKTRYSVPHNYIGERVEVHADTNIVEIYFREKLIAQHRRTDKGGFVTELAHMPEAHQHHEKWNEERIRSWAAQQGAQVLEWVNGQFESREHPAQAYRVCLGLLNLSRTYPKRLNDACGAANRNGLLRLKQVKELLRNNMDRLPLLKEENLSLPQDHENIRGPQQYR